MYLHARLCITKPSNNNISSQECTVIFTLRKNRIKMICIPAPSSDVCHCIGSLIFGTQKKAPSCMHTCTSISMNTIRLSWDDFKLCIRISFLNTIDLNVFNHLLSDYRQKYLILLKHMWLTGWLYNMKWYSSVLSQ